MSGYRPDCRELDKRPAKGIPKLMILNGSPMAYDLRKRGMSRGIRGKGLSMKRTQEQGFTLVEIAIVLVIVGLLLGGILKGQEMITQAKIKNSISDFSGVSAAYFGYLDRYRSTPGDDASATRWSGATAGNGDRKLAGLFNSTTAGDE